MSKEYIQALDDLFGLVAFLPGESFKRAQKYFDVIEPALQRLEQIDNANLSEALKTLKEVENGYSFLDQTIGFCYEKELNIVKQALVKAQEQEQEKFTSIVKSKCINNDNLYFVTICESYKMYKIKCKLVLEDIITVNINEKDMLTEEEFTIVKEKLK